MTETNEPKPEKKGFLQRMMDKFKSTSKEVSGKVEDTISDVKNSEFGEKVSEMAKNVGEKAQDIVQDVKDSQFVDKVGDIKDTVVDKAKTMSSEVTNFCSDKVKNVIGKIDFDNTLNTLKEKQEKTGRDMSKLINFVEKLQNIK